MGHRLLRRKSGLLDGLEAMPNYPALLDLGAGTFFTCAASQDC